MKTAVFCFLFLLLPINCICEENIASEQLEISGAEELEISSDSMLGDDFSFSDTAENFMEGKTVDPRHILNSFISGLFAELKSNIVCCIKIIIIALLLCIMTNFSGSDSKLLDVSFYVCYMVIFIFCMNSLTIASDIASQAIETMDLFMKSAVPVFGSLITASGGAARLTLISVGILGVCSAIGAITSVIIPLCRITAVFSGVNNLSTEFNLKGMAAAIKKTALWTLGIIMTIFTAVISAQSFASVHIDNVALKTAKYAAGNFIPLVGGALSDTMESVVACGKMVKGAAGAAGIIAVLYICLTPIIKLIAVIVTYKIAAVIISPFSDRRITDAVNEFSGSLVILLALVIAAALMFIVITGMVCAV